MTRHLLIFAACFLAGAVLALTVRTALHHPYTSPAGTPPATMADHAEHVEPAPAAAPVGAAPTDAKPVNTTCAICGMPVNPALPTAVYQGKVIGFGCKTCPAKFAAHPDTYGPAALANTVVE